MDNELKKLLIEAWEKEESLVELVKECLKEIFVNDSHILYSFEEDLADGREYNGCLQGLQYYKTMAKERSERLAGLKKEVENNEKP